MASQDRRVLKYSIRDIQLEQWDLFEDLLISQRFCQRALGIPRGSLENAAIAAEIMVKALKGSKYKLDELNHPDAMQVALNAAKDKASRIYSTPERACRLAERIDEALTNKNSFQELGREAWAPICGLFASGDGRRNSLESSTISSPAVAVRRPRDHSL